MVLGKLPVPGRPTNLIAVGQGPVALAVGAGWGGLDIFRFLDQNQMTQMFQYEVRSLPAANKLYTVDDCIGVIVTLRQCKLNVKILLHVSGAWTVYSTPAYLIL